MSELYNFIDINGNPFEEKLHCTEDSHGLMCPEDKIKLASIEEGANKTIVDTERSSTSENPVQNKVINTTINNLNTLIGNTPVSEQINTAVSNLAVLDLSNVDNNTFKSKVEESGFSSGTKVQFVTWEETD